MRRFTHPAPLPDPPKNELSIYYSPAYATYPGGVPFVDTDTPRATEWIVQN